jgi:hypothetical protein
MKAEDVTATLEMALDASGLEEYSARRRSAPPIENMA